MLQYVLGVPVLPVRILLADPLLVLAMRNRRPVDRAGQTPNAIPALRYISRISFIMKAISGDLSPLRVLIMIGETACF